VGKPLTGWRAAPGTPWQWLRGENFGEERALFEGAQLSLDQSDPEREVFTVRKEGGAADQQQQQQLQQQQQQQHDHHQGCQRQQHRQQQMQQHQQHQQHQQQQHQPGYEQPQGYATAALYEAQPAPLGAQQGGGYAPLPAGWCAAVDEASGQTYYYHELTGVSQWEPPQAEHGYGGYSVDLRGGYRSR